MLLKNFKIVFWFFFRFYFDKSFLKIYHTNLKTFLNFFNPVSEKFLIIKQKYIACDV